MAIDLYVYVTVRRLSNFYEEKFRLEYYDVEHCNTIDQIKNNLIRGVLTYLNWDDPVHIALSSDIPGYSGLGTSSSFCVGLIGALRYLRGDSFISLFELAKNVMEVELDVLELKMGIQDALPASFGGLHTYYLHKGRQFSVSKLDESSINTLIKKGCLFLVWTGDQRASKSVLDQQIKSLREDDDLYKCMRELSINFADAIQVVNQDPGQMIDLIENTVKKADVIKNRMVTNLVVQNYLVVISEVVQEKADTSMV
jgi:D-glycero-alpha-D-manno-heptose-7-phosphate kinase